MYNKVMREKVYKFKTRFKRNLRDLFMLIVFILVVGGLYFFFLLKPSNDRDWEYGFENLPKIEIGNDTVNVKNLRDSRFEASGESKIEYLERTFNLKNLERTWFVLEPFTIKPFTSFKGIAHTYFVFDFSDTDPVVVSVEARREKGEKYDSWWGALNQYELIYTWGTEQNQTVRRVVAENNKLFMYPLMISKEQSQHLFLQLARTTHELETTPRFYNSFLSNCTNELAKNANEIAPGSIPENRALYLPGYSAQALYDLKLIPTNLPLETLTQKADITEVVRKTSKDPDFSKKLREHLNSI